MTDEKEREKLYKLENEIVEKGAEFYYTITKGNDDYLKYVVSKRIHCFRHGIYPNKKIILHEISNNWKDFFKKTIITNEDYLCILNKYKDNENAFLYLDPPYMDSFNAKYSTYKNKKSYDNDLKIIDNTEMYIKLLDILKNGKCKILFSINDCALTNYLYKDFIKESYNHIYKPTYVNIKDLNENVHKKYTNILIISNF
jgi:site-specific DNA-adenine methylase